MKEVFPYSQDEPANQRVFEVAEGSPIKVSVSGGIYRDPDPGVIRWLNERFTDPNRNIEATLMKAFEWAGVVKTIKEIDGMAKPLEQSGVLPPTTGGDEPPEFRVQEGTPSDFMDRREERLFLELVQGNEDRNELLERVRNSTAERQFYGEAEESQLIEFIKEFRRQSPEFTPVFRILRVMLGVTGPETPIDRFSPNPPKQTRELAPDVYFMLLKQEQEAEIADEPAA